MSVFIFIVWWTLCGATAYALFTWFPGCYFDEDRAIRAILAILGPIAVVTLVVIYSYFFVVRKLIEGSAQLVQCKQKYVEPARTDVSALPAISKCCSTPNMIFK